MNNRRLWNVHTSHRLAVGLLLVLAAALTGCGKTAEEYIITVRAAKTSAEQEEILTEALDAYPDLAQARLWRARVYAHQRKTDAALADYDHIIQQIIDRRSQVQKQIPKLEAAVRRAQLKRDNLRHADPAPGELRKADEEVRRAVSDLAFGRKVRETSYKDIALAYYRRGRALDLNEQYEPAVENYSTALRSDPGLLNSYSARAEAFFKLRKYANAKQDLGAVLSRDISSGGRSDAAARERRGEWRLRRGFAGFCTGEWSSATTDFRGAITDMKSKARKALAVLNLYFVACRVGDKAENDKILLEYADKTLSPRTRATPWVYVAVWYCAGLMREEKAFLEASKHTNAAEQAVRMARAYYYIGARQRILGDADKAAEAYAKCVASKNVDLFEYHMASVELERLKAGGRTAGDYVAMARKVKDPTRKIELYTDALRIDPTHTDARLNRAVLYSLSGTFDLAIDDCTRLLKLYKRPVNIGMAYYHRAWARARKGQHREAVKDCMAALESDPQLWQARQELAGSLCYLRSYEDAARVYAQLVKEITARGMLDFWRLQRTHALSCAGDWETAAGDLRVAVKRKGSSPLLQVHLLIAESKRGNRDRAMAALKRRAKAIKVAGWDSSVLWYAAGMLSTKDMLKACQHSDVTEQMRRTVRAYYYIGALSRADARVESDEGKDALAKCVAVGKKLRREPWEYRLAIAELERLNKK
jgi:tetratricopeptide (TPR) repeat protein